MSDTFDFTHLLAETVPFAPASPHLMAARDRPKFDFAVAYPDLESFPNEALTEALGRALKDNKNEMVLYPHAQGLPELRQLVADKLASERDIKVGIDQVLITPGSGQAIALFTELFTNPGDTIITEEFTYSNALNVMRRFGANIVGAPLDHEGIRPDALDEIIQDLVKHGNAPKFIYTIPTFQNPTGADMGIKRRHEILAVAQKHRVPIYEDDCYMDLRFEGDPAPAMFAADDSEMVLYSGSFSKIIAPGMRLGWMVAPSQLVGPINSIHLGTPPSVFSSLAALYYLRDNMKQHVSELCDIFRAKRDTMLSTLGETMGSSIVCTRPPGGLYLWVQLANRKDVGAAYEEDFLLQQASGLALTITSQAPVAVRYTKELLLKGMDLNLDSG
ncbi:aminotransferase class I/II-fold pyridoxal phosphate-dependent enzyme, partial [SAR202 cluster bacterium AD-802-E10_MRT_200m]|nr:aminotransferase class I/II-fold pyridoxal phosphate-dependent enzyme [SAR202 cluster bacterium AD-802-E10_MRT_200m]